jgi:hypothetical protein
VVEVAAPLGLDDLFNLVVRPTVKFRADKRQVYLNRLRSKNWLATWPDLKVLPIGRNVSASKFHARFGSLAAIPERPLLADCCLSRRAAIGQNRTLPSDY